VGLLFPHFKGKKENEKIFPGQGLFKVIRIKGLGLMGKMCLQVDSFPFFLDQFSIACHGCIHENSRAEAVLGTDIPEGRACHCP